MSTSARGGGTPAPAPAPARRDTRRAWISLALLPVAFVLASLLGDGLLGMQGYQSGTEEAIPLGVVLLAAGPAVLVLVTPGVAAAWYGLRARRAGQPGGLLPAVIGVVVTLGLIALNTAAFFVGT